MKRWILFFLSILMLSSLACQLGQEVEVVPTIAPPTTTPIPTKTPAPTKTTENTNTPPPTAEPTRELTIVDLQAATVQILARDEFGFILWTGSGTIISPDGLVLTNAHVAKPTAPGLATFYNDPEFLSTDDPYELVVALVDAADRPPIESYLAEVKAADGSLDLAVIRITQEIDGGSIDDLNLPYLPLGDSDSVQLGDEVRVLGFPGAGGDTITFTRGDVSGFESQERIGFRAWIKTDTTVSPGNSGGLGANISGEIIGVPSFVIEAQGGAINRLRSINLARPLIEAAQNETAYTSPYVIEGTGNESIEFVTWAEDYDVDTSCAINPVSAYPADALATIAIFEYSGMQEGQQVMVSWQFNGEFLTNYIFEWEDGESGDCIAFYLHNYGDPIGEGVYVVEVYAGAELDLLAEERVIVGGSGRVSPPTGEVRITGKITDADTGQGIEDATIFFLLPNTDLEEWLEDPQVGSIYSLAETNEHGEYNIPDLLARDVSYPAAILADGYRTEDGYLTLDEEDRNPYILNIELSP